jgi:gas vesicle protein
MAEENKAYNLAWFIAGLGIGALVGVLYAPKSGRETREEIAHGAREGADYVRTKTRDAAQQVGAFVDRSKEQVSTIVDHGKEQATEYIDRGRAQWEEFVERGKNLVGDQTSRVTAAIDAGRQAYSAAAAPDKPAEL